MPQNVMDLIDQAVDQYYITKDKGHFNTFVKHATPIIQKFVRKAYAGSTWDTEELFSILLTDMWRLVSKYSPEEGKKFHWLMLKQLRNKIINYVYQVRGRPHKICNICNTKQNGAGSICKKCGAPLRLPDIIISGITESVYGAHFPDYLNDIANRQLVAKLLGEVKNDPKTFQILQMLLEGKSKSEISREIHLAQNAMNNRIRKCRKIIHKFIEGKKLCRL